MRFTLAAASAAALLLSSSSILATADECSCPHQGGSYWDGSNSINTGISASSNDNTNGDASGNNWSDPWSQPAPIRQVPKVKPTKKNLQKGTVKAIEQLQEKKVIPADLGKELQEAINKAIDEHTTKQVVAEVAASGTTTTVTITPSATVVPTTIVDANGAVSTVYMTQTITALPPGATILSNQTIAALDSIEDAIRDAIKSVTASKSGLDATAQAELEKCLSAVLTNGGLPEGYSCISQSGSTSAGLQATFANSIEQLIGILPARIIDSIQDAVTPMLTDLLPSESVLLSNINSAISSVVSSLSGNSVTAIEGMQACYALAIRQHSNTSYLQCWTAEGGPFDALNTATSAVVEQFVGVLPGSVLDSVRNITKSTLTAGAGSALGAVGTNLTDQLDNALASVANSLTGNSVTLYKQLQDCMNELIRNGNATAAEHCLTQDPAASARTMLMSMANQWSGYLPSSFFSDLVRIVENMDNTGSYTEAQIVDALEQAFNNANMGPAYVGCFEQVQGCVLDEIRSTGNIGATCPGPQPGCELIGSNNSTSLANATLASELSAASLATATATIIADNSTVIVPSATSNGTDSSVPAPAATATSSMESAASDSTLTSPSSGATPTETSSEAAVSMSDPVVAVFRPTETASSATDAMSSSPASTAVAVDDVPASSATDASSESVAATSPSAPASDEVPVAPSATQRFTKKSIKRSHQKLRLMYSEHYPRF